jgi:hypothetical protein
MQRPFVKVFVRILVERGGTAWEVIACKIDEEIAGGRVCVCPRICNDADNITATPPIGSCTQQFVVLKK